ncbi:MAG: hypothetical protein RL538_913 [Candidatus Parcubacteria bacterium]|jgi:hypothetical protein
MYLDRTVAVPTATLQNPVAPTPSELASSMVMLEVMHHTFKGEIKTGSIIIHELVLRDVRDFFKEAFALKFPVHSIIPVSEFRWNDEASCFANNSSGQNMRYLDDGRMSKHGIGCAFDINPRQNPCFVLDEETLRLEHIIPWDGIYVPGTDGTLQKGDRLVKLMQERGWSWGGNWTFPKDYQHFQIVPPELASYVAPRD